MLAYHYRRQLNNYLKIWLWDWNWFSWCGTATFFQLHGVAFCLCLLFAQFKEIGCSFYSFRRVCRSVQYLKEFSVFLLILYLHGAVLADMKRDGQQSIDLQSLGMLCLLQHKRELWSDGVHPVWKISDSFKLSAWPKRKPAANPRAKLAWVWKHWQLSSIHIVPIAWPWQFFVFLGPEEDVPRKLECMEFVCHAPSEYFKARHSPYPPPSSASNSCFIWTRLGPQIRPVPTQEQVFGTF